MQLDNTDLEIVRLLSEDGRASYSDISKSIGVSAGTVRNRIKHMRSAGFLHVKGWLDPYRSGVGVHAILLVKVRCGRVDEAISALADLDETGYVATLAGSWDAVVDAFCDDVAHLRRLIHDKIQRIDGVLDFSTHVVTETKYESSVNFLGIYSDSRGGTAPPVPPTGV